MPQTKEPSVIGYSAIVMVVFSIVHCTSVVPAVDSNRSARMTHPNNVVQFVGIGYNLIKGNPEGEFHLGGLDRGFRLARRVFKLTYDLGKTATYGSCGGQSGISIPDQVAFQPIHSCSGIQSVNVFSGTKSYQRKIDTSITTRGSVSSGFFNARFSLSTGFSQARANTQTHQRVIMDKDVVCNRGRARYQLDTALNNHYSISDDFYYAVKNLPAHRSNDAYMNFIEDWGTHFIESADIGGRRTERYTSSYLEVYNQAATSASGSIHTGGSYLGYQGSITVDINTFSNHITHTTQLGAFAYRVNSGSSISQNSDGSWYVSYDDCTPPIPIRMTLNVLTTAFDPRLWTQLPENATYESLGIAGKKANLEMALGDYPNFVHAVAGSDPLVRIPNAWPDGTYSLPKASSGCPASGNHFNWQEGSRFQDNEDFRNANSFTSRIHLAGSFGRNIRINYCTKTMTSGDYGIKWPRGSYCIARKGGACPQGFRSGYVYWDDEDRRNINSYNGILPDGSYTRNTRIEYCCRNDLHPTNVIMLPTDRPFFLLRKHHDGCQHVKNMRVRMEHIHWDDEDRRNDNSQGGSYPFGAGGRNHNLYFCYYY